MTRRPYHLRNLSGYFSNTLGIHAPSCADRFRMGQLPEAAEMIVDRVQVYFNCMRAGGYID